MKLSMKSTVALNNGVEMPLLGYGTALISDDPAKNITAVREALEVGYRHIDTATCYKNEKEVGIAVKESGIPREDIFITTKVWTDPQREGKQLEAFYDSLKALDMDYVDLYLIHWPVPGKVVETWKVMEKVYKEGRVRAIGVCSCHPHYIEAIMGSSDVVPAVNQYEFHPRVTSLELRAYCAKHNIAFEAFMPLGQGLYRDDPTIIELAQKYNKSVAQILIRWELQHHVITIPKTVTKSRMIENADIFDFELSPWDMTRIDALNVNKRIVSHVDPDNVDF